MLTLDQLKAICPQTPVGRLAVFVEPLNAVFEDFEVKSTQRRQAYFFGQFAHETEGFTRLEENLYYTTAEALVGATKPRWDALDVDDAWGYLRQPERLANRVYANRNGNGPEASGDGWKFRGRGFPHMTFMANYQAAGEALNLDLLEQPDLLLDPMNAAAAGGWYWRRCKGNAFADLSDFDGLTVAVNGGKNGLSERKAYCDRALRVLG